MCGRYTLGLTKKSLEERYDAELEEQLIIPRYNVAPTQAVPAITMQHPDKISVLHWGLIPSWAKDPAIASKLINARSETISQKPSFSKAFASQRCLIPCTGFYEWQKLGGKKIPHFIFHTKHKIISLAGLYEQWTNPHGIIIRTCTIITTQVNQTLKKLHHRMPAFLNPNEEKHWLNPHFPEQDLLSLLKPGAESDFTFHTVSTKVNKVAIDKPELIEKFDHGDIYTQGSLF